MAYDGHILCRNLNCRRVLYLGKYKGGGFYSLKVEQVHFANGIAKFIFEHFPHGELSIMGDGPFEKYLDATPERDWPIRVFVRVDEQGKVQLVEDDSEWIN